MKTIILILIIFIFMLCTSRAFAEDNICKNEVVTQLKNFELFFSKKDYIAICYDYQIQMRDSLIHPALSKIKYAANKNKSVLITDDIEVFQDSSISYSIQKSRKEILISDKHSYSNRLESYNMTNIIDLIEKYGILDSCVDLNDKNYDKLIVIRISDSIKTGFAGVKIKYFISEKKNKLVKIITDFPPTSRTKSIELDYYDNDSDEMKSMLNTETSSFLYNSKSKLKAKYERFRIIDQRSNKRK